MDLQLRFCVTELTWRDVTDVFGFQFAVRVHSLVWWTPMACASNMDLVLSLAHLLMTALQFDNKLRSSIHTIKQVMQLCECD